MAVQQLSVTDVYDALLTTTLRNYRAQLEDNIFQDLPLLFWLDRGDRKKLIDGGESIMRPLLYGENSTVQLFEGYDLLNVAPQEGLTMSKWNWKSMGVSVSISREQERKNSGKHKLLDLLQAKVEQAEASMQWYLNDLLHGRHGSHQLTFTGGDTNTYDSVGGTLVEGTVLGTMKGFNSLDHIVSMPWGYCDPASTNARTRVVGGLTTSVTMQNVTGAAYADWLPTSGLLSASAYTNPWWLNYSNPGFQRLTRGEDGGTLGSVLTQTEIEWAGEILGGTDGVNVINAMRSMYNRLSSGANHPDLLLSGQAMYEAYEAALTPNERFTNMEVGDAGFQNLKFKGATFIFDHGITTALPTVAPTSAAPATPLYLLNSKTFEWVVDQETDWYVTPFYRPPNQVARTAQILLMAQLVCRNRSRNGVIACANYANGYGTA